LLEEMKRVQAKMVKSESWIYDYYRNDFD
jgi:hypothetical protein